jgi:predicted nucleic acid-binding protein
MSMLISEHVEAPPAGPPRRRAVPTARTRVSPPEGPRLGPRAGRHRRRVSGRPPETPRRRPADPPSRPHAGPRSRAPPPPAGRAARAPGVIVVDTTVLVYAVGAEHPLRDPCRALVEAVADGEVRVTTTVEVIQEFTHVRARRRSRADAVALARSYADLFAPLLPVGADELVAGLKLFERTEALEPRWSLLLPSATVRRAWSPPTPVSPACGAYATSTPPTRASRRSWPLWLRTGRRPCRSRCRGPGPR